MYKIDVQIKGIAPLLQHKFPLATLEDQMVGARKKTGAPDYAYEWLDTMYVSKDGFLCQPASHIEGTMVKAATSFRIKGSGRKTWKDPIRAYCYVGPEEIIHLYNGASVVAPGPELLSHPTDHLSVSVMRAKVQRAAIARSRLMIAVGWELVFVIEVHDSQVRPDVVRDILTEAGRAAGIGDYRPRYGRFEIIDFTIHDEQ